MEGSSGSPKWGAGARARVQTLSLTDSFSLCKICSRPLGRMKCVYSAKASGASRALSRRYQLLPLLFRAWLAGEQPLTRFHI